MGGRRMVARTISLRSCRTVLSYIWFRRSGWISRMRERERLRVKGWRRRRRRRRLRAVLFGRLIHIVGGRGRSTRREAAYITGRAAVFAG